MAEIFHEVPIETDAASLYSMLTNEELLSSWWLPGTKIEAKEGTTGTFPLSDGQNQIVMRVEQLVPSKRVVWRCLAHKFPEWKDTQVSFEIVEGPSAVTLQFRHSDWKDTTGVFGKTSFYWASLYLKKLETLLETRSAPHDQFSLNTSTTVDP